MYWGWMNEMSESETGHAVAARSAGLVEVLNGAGGEAGEDDEEECGDHGSEWDCWWVVWRFLVVVFSSVK